MDRVDAESHCNYIVAKPVVTSIYGSSYDFRITATLIQFNTYYRWLGGEFISADRVCCWSDAGTGYLYKLPTNCIVESKDFHNKNVNGIAGR